MASSKRLAFFLPNIFTALNLACGFGSIILSVRGQVFEGALILLLGAIFDSVDGRVARLTGTQSAFGEQFDSMSDVVSFGVAPAFLIHQEFLADLGRIGAVGSFVYLLCGALRLARFNANIEKVSSDFFQGMPIPGAAMAMIGYVFLSEEFPFLKDLPFVALLYTAFFGILMISNIPFCSFKNSEWVRKHRKAVLFFIFIIACLTFAYYKYMFAVNLISYTVASLIYYFTHKERFTDAFVWNSEE